MSVIFVFGSNLAGRHGKGAAKEAYDHWDAKYGQGVGYQGRSYAIPTKDANLKVLPLAEIEKYVAEFIQFAIEYPKDIFVVTGFGTGLAGYNPRYIFDMFDARLVPENVYISAKLACHKENPAQFSLL